MHSVEEMARAGCTTARGIRFWEEKGLFGEVARSEGDTRQFTSEQMDRARIIAAAQFGGWSLDDIRDMINEWGHEAYEAICQRLSDQMKAAIRLIENLPKPPANKEYDL